MRFWVQILAVAVALAAIIGFGTLATGSMHSLERKQQRALDVDIDWIVAHRRREAGKAQVAAAPMPAPETNGSAPAREETRRVEPRDPDVREKEKEEAGAAVAQARRSAAKRTRNARRNPLLPRDFGQLPLFTVQTLLGLR